MVIATSSAGVRSQEKAAPARAGGARLHAFDGELVGLAQRLDVAALRRPYGLDIEWPVAEIGKHLGHVEIEKVGTSISHDRFRSAGLRDCAVHNDLYRTCCG